MIINSSILPYIHSNCYCQCFHLATKNPYSVQFQIILSSKVNLCYGNGLAPCYMPILHEGSDWPQAIAKLVLILTGQARGEIMCQLIKTPGTAAESIKNGQMAAFGCSLLWYSTTPQSSFTNVLMDLETYAEFLNINITVLSLLICQICIADFSEYSSLLLSTSRAGGVKGRH